ncbi:MAG: hypothetical protein EHM35_12700 [Planctomycetaceae bacterium]|nr:MAG: hypothetical protein EHM35_12700 [Planctomycetaceae bacterium]
MSDVEIQQKIVRFDSLDEIRAKRKRALSIPWELHAGRTNNGIILQQAFDWQGNKTFVDMLRLTYQRHASYAEGHRFDYWHMVGPLLTNHWGGGWCKVELIRLALSQGYEFVAWIDSDAAIIADRDLREALPEGRLFGAVLHDAPWFHAPEWQIPPHYNVGVSFWRAGALPLVEEWLSLYDEFRQHRWMEQGAFQRLIELHPEAFHACDTRWNATVNVHETHNAFILGWHGINPLTKRIGMMKATLRDDFLKFRV